MQQGSRTKFNGVECVQGNLTFLDALASLEMDVRVRGTQFFKTADYEIFRL